MSHAHLLSQKVPLELNGRMHPQHKQLIQDRLSDLERRHAPRIRQVSTERDILRGNVFTTSPLPGVHHVAPPIPHTIAKRVSALMLPKHPIIRAESHSSEHWAKQEADITQRWAYAMHYNMKSQLTYQHWAREGVNHGVGGVHLLADRWADEEREVPIIQEVADTTGILYHMGPRHKMSYGFVKHRMSIGDMRRYLDTEPTRAKDRNDSTLVDTWCYYTEERVRDEKSGMVKIRVLYTVLEGNEPLYPLVDMTPLWPEIPLYLFFNTDGYSWRGEEAMNARGVWTGSQSLILYAIDLMTQTANGMLKYVNPALLVKVGATDESPDLDDRPGAHNEVGEDTDIKTFNQGQPQPQSVQYTPQVLEMIGMHTDPSFSLQPKDLEGVGGSAFMQQMQPSIVENRQRQMGLEFGIGSSTSAMLYHLASVGDPIKGMRMRGLDPRDGNHINEIVTPDMLRDVDIYAKLTQHVPAQLYQHLNMMMQLADKGFIPHALMTEQAMDLMEMPYRDMTTVTRELAADQAYKVMIQQAQAAAQQALPYLHQAAYNEGLSPNQLASDGSAPYALSSQWQDPHLLEDQSYNGPVQQAAENAQVAIHGDY